MSLNIKDPEAHKLAQELARETGQSMTRAVTEALHDQLDRVRRQNGRGSRKEILRAIARRFRRKVKGPIIPHDELLYDERGLPR